MMLKSVALFFGVFFLSVLALSHSVHEPESTWNALRGGGQLRPEEKRVGFAPRHFHHLTNATNSSRRSFHVHQKLHGARQEFANGGDRKSSFSRKRTKKLKPAEAFTG